MMPLLYRLRRSVALFVCPELSAEARVKATLDEARKMRAPAAAPLVSLPAIMNAEERLRLEQRLLFESRQPWRDLLEWLTEQQRNDWRFATNDEAAHYIGHLILLVGERQGKPGRRAI